MDGEATDTSPRHGRAACEWWCETWHENHWADDYFEQRDVAWSYSRSQAAHCPPQQGEPSAPSFTERHWAGPSYATSATDDDEDEDEEDDAVDDAEGEVDDGQDYDDTFGAGQMIETGTAGTSTQPHAPRHRTLERITQQDTDTTRGRLRNARPSRSPQQIAIATGSRSDVHSTDDAPAHHHHHAYLGADGMVKAVKGSASDFPSFRVGSHYERYADNPGPGRHVRSWRDSTSSDGQDDGQERGRGRQISRTRQDLATAAAAVESTPLLLSHRGRPRIGRMYSGRSAKGSLSASPDVERGRSRSATQTPGASRAQSPQVTTSGASEATWWSVLTEYIAALLPCVGSRTR